jgi:hypothetical protein
VFVARGGLELYHRPSQRKSGVVAKHTFPRSWHVVFCHEEARRQKGSQKPYGYQSAFAAKFTQSTSPPTPLDLVRQESSRKAPLHGSTRFQRPRVAIGSHHPIQLSW